MIASGSHFCPNCGFNQTPDPIVEIGGWTIDVRNHEALFKGRRVHFTPIEMTILHTLASAKGQIVTRDALRERSGSDGDTNSLQVLVHRVRRKIAATPLRILTVRTRGLRLIERAGS